MAGRTRVTAWIGLGSNLGDSKAILRRAVRELGRLGESQCSALYQSPAWGKTDEPDYINAVMRVATTRPPLALLEYCQQLEAQAGRVRTVKWGARTLDLDILLYGEQVIDIPELTVPHPFLSQRQFVLQPMAEIDAELVVPGIGKTVAVLLDALGEEALLGLDSWG
jgi:2-amino-4-hydroxy-6-hydroxymethyldihydropteridine diphosphokinase